MSDLWLISRSEDERLQGISCDSQVLYMRLFRRYADFDTGRVSVTLGQMKCCLEFIPDAGSQESPRRVSSIGNHYIRARISELERAGLISRLPKRNRFEAPVFQCEVLAQGLVRPKSEPQRNRKGGTAKGTTSESSNVVPFSGHGADKGTAKEPQGGNRKIPGIPERVRITSPIGEEASGPPECPHQAIIALYHELLPANPPVKVWGDTRKGYLRTRWREDRKRQSLDYWRRLFTFIAEQCPFLTGQQESGGRRPFLPGLEWMIKPTNFAKIIEGQYREKRNAN